MIYETLNRLLPLFVQESTKDYTLEQLNAMTVWQRLQIRDWRLEIFTMGFIAIFVFLFKTGDLYNKSKVTGFLSGISEVMNKQFYQFGVSPNQLYIKDSSENYSSYATGRVNIASVQINFTLVPRYNVFLWILESGFSFFSSNVKAPEDTVDIVITPSGHYDNFITAIVSKLGMNDARKFNYFLSLCKTSDSPNLPESFVYMSEANEFQEKTTTNELKNSLNLQIANVVKFIALTDQPVEKPESLREFMPNRKVIISLKATTSKKDLKQISAILEAVFNLVDKLVDTAITFRPEAVKRVVKTREAEIEKLKKIQEEARKEELAEEQAKLKREERDRLRNMSREEQLKAEKKAAERRQKKMQKKQRIKM
ncbi:UPF0674 endoplasmic reticulum membrane protein [Candida tropicalis]